MMKSFVAHDGDRALKFNGTLIGSATSDDGHKQRWMDMCIYRTEAGSYIIEKIGRSRIAGEENRHSAQVCESAEGAVESLYQYDDQDVRYMTRVTREAAAAAALVDDDFATAYRIEHVA